MSAAKIKAQTLINDNGVMMFSKSYCPHSTAAKTLLAELGADYAALDLDEVTDGAAIQEALLELTGQSSVPNIFIDRRYIGGNSELQLLTPELPALLAEAGAI